MKKILLLLPMVFLLWNCSAKPQPVSERPINPNTEFRQIEIDMIREGDKLIKVQALLGEPTTQKNTQDGKLWIWWLRPATGIEHGYETLTDDPDKNEKKDLKFIKLQFNKKNRITKKEYDM